MNMLNLCKLYAMSFLAIEELNKKQIEDDIQKEWKESAKYPRKKKKRVRKSLLFRMSMVQYDPLNIPKKKIQCVKLISKK